MNTGVKEEIGRLLGSLRIVHRDMAACQSLVDMPGMASSAEEHLVGIERLVENSPTAGLPANEVIERLDRIENSIAEFREELAGPKKGSPFTPADDSGPMLVPASLDAPGSDAAPAAESPGPGAA